MLASIAGIVDFLVVNDNSGLERSENVAVLEASAFARDGRLQIVRRPFAGFATMRNDAFAPLLALPRPPEWLLFIDADEVHGEQIARSRARSCRVWAPVSRNSTGTPIISTGPTAGSRTSRGG